ncbi:YceD family protein [Mesoplasma photuris]|uniref:YceD family protein n=1 Tax=Mesoplasma photuris TaxID=217731 RepID=UPI0004E25E91|nr:YceD family protein [Mesoplasma photuris]
MHLSELRNKSHQELTDAIKNPELIVSKQRLIKEYLAIDYDIDLDYLQSIETIEINGVINFEILAIDARDGKEFIYKDGIDWREEYTFSQELNDQANLILGDEFNLEEYLIEQININIPVNISKNNDIIFKTGSGWSLLSEQQYQNSKNDKPDPRWDKLSEINIDKK